MIPYLLSMVDTGLKNRAQQELDTSYAKYQDQSNTAISRETTRKDHNEQRFASSSDKETKRDAQRKTLVATKNLHGLQEHANSTNAAYLQETARNNAGLAGLTNSGSMNQFLSKVDNSTQKLKDLNSKN